MDQINTGLYLMVVGMGVVFVYLSILVFCVWGVSALVRHFKPEAPAASAAPVAAPAAAPAASADQEVASAITAAIHKYRQNK